MVTSLIILCLERAHGCLGAWEGGPVVPGPPPLGPWGASRGLPRGGVPAESLRTRSGPAPLVFASNFVSILMSIFGRLGVDLGPFLGVMLGSYSHLFRPKLVPEPSSNRLIFEKVCFTKNERRCSHSTILRSKSAQDGALNDPRSLQDGSKIVLDRFFCLLIFCFDF